MVITEKQRKTDQWAMARIMKFVEFLVLFELNGFPSDFSNPGSTKDHSSTSSYKYSTDNAIFPVLKAIMLL